MHRDILKTPLRGPYGTGAVRFAEQVRDSGANAMWFHGFHEGGFEACTKYGLAACVELKTFRADFKKHPELIPTGIDGKPIRYGSHVQGICLSKTEYVDQIAEDLERNIAVYKPVGVWMDYLTYGGWFETPQPDLQQSCFCRACVDEFVRETGVDADDPAVIVSRHLDAWTDHKCARIAKLGNRFAGIIRAHRPDSIIGLYMCPWYPEDFDGALRRIFAQDYKLLAEFADVFTPLIYAEKCGRSPEWSREFMERSPEFVPEGTVVQPILDVLDFPESLEALGSSKVPSWGTQIFGASSIVEREDGVRLLEELYELPGLKGGM